MRGPTPEEIITRARAYMSGHQSWGDIFVHFDKVVRDIGPLARNESGEALSVEDQRAVLANVRHYTPANDSMLPFSTNNLAWIAREGAR